MNKNKDCPEGKEINAITGRCVKKCKDGEKRDLKTGKCMKIKLNKKFNKSIRSRSNAILNNEYGSERLISWISIPFSIRFANKENRLSLTARVIRLLY